MSPPSRRRSARLASVPVKKNKAAPLLSSVAEREDTPTRDAPQSLDKIVSPAQFEPRTPVTSTPKPPHDEMHPSKARPTTGEPSSALRLGFADIPSQKDRRHGVGLTATPSKIGALPSSPFTFQFSRKAADTALSGEAQRMMDEIRDQAAKIKADLVAQREAEAASTANVSARVIAKPKGKSGRFSAAHMAEFKKMDSIEGHASAWRAQHGRSTPVDSSLKRSPSKANLDATPTTHASGIKPSPSKTRLGGTAGERPKHSLKRTSSVANLDYHPREAEPQVAATTATSGKPHALASGGQQSAVKRRKQREEDDSSSARPVSRDGSSLPRPKSRGDNSASLPRSHSGLMRLMSPTKSSMAHMASPGKSTFSLATSPSSMGPPGLAKSASTTSLGSTASKTADDKRPAISPGRFQKIKSILRGQTIDTDGVRSAIPQPAVQMSQTPAPSRNAKALPRVPQTTPRRKLRKRVAFTPETAQAAMSQNSPSPKKPGTSSARPPLRAIHSPYPGLDEVLAEPKPPSTYLYPDLSPLKRLVEPHTPGGTARAPSVPGTFTFRCDQTIKFGDVPATGFGASPGQSSVRHIRGSLLTATAMPGSFPAPPSPSCHPDKENTSPVGMIPGTAHGMPNKKRHRPSSDEEDAEHEAAERAMKKRKNEHVPEGQALLAPRLVGTGAASGVKKWLDQTPSKTPSRTPGRVSGRTAGSASASKSRTGPVLTMSRLSMLARPKNRG